MSKLELKVPPVVVVVATAAIMWTAAVLTPTFTPAFHNHHLVAILFVLLGFLISFLGVFSFRRAKTTVNPLKPQSASSLVTSGIYRHTRNPMYLGFLICLIGWSVFLANPFALTGLPFFILYMNRFQIQPEERALTQLFGEEFRQYQANVRRWL